MFISIDPETKTASIQEPEVLTAFHIESPEHNEDAVASIIGNGAEAMLKGKSPAIGKKTSQEWCNMQRVKDGSMNPRHI